MFSAALKSGAAAAPTDPQFNYVTMLLHGDGTNGGQNNTFLDSSTNNFTITRNGNTTQGSFSPYGANWSNYFSGSVDCFAVLDNAAFNLSSGAFTIECWINTTVLSGYQTILSKRAAVWEIGLSNNTLYWWVGSTVYTTTTTVTSAAWTHFAVSSDGTNIKLFVNGVLDRTVTGANPGSGAGNVFICSAGNGTQYYAGYLSNLRVVKGSNLYTSNFTPSTTPLTAVSGTSLLTCQSNRFIDNSSNAFAITVTGTPSVQRFSPFAPSTAYSTATIGGSGYFDGSGDYLVAPTNAAFAYGTADFTVEVSVYKAASGTQTIIDASGTGTFGFQFTNTQLISFASNATTFTFTYTLPLNSWVHVALVRSSGTLYFYANGVLIGSTACTYNFVSSGDYRIGSHGSLASEFWNGYISNLRIVKGTAVYTAAFTPPSAPLTAITNTSLLLNCINGSIFDNAMMNDLETVGNAQISTSVKKYGTGSLAFDGSGDYLTAPSNSLFNFGSGDFTMEGWFYQTGLSSSYPGLVSNPLGWGSAGAWGVLSSHAASGVRKLQFYCYNYSSTTPLLLGTTTLSDNTWYYFTVTRSGSTFRLFLNGTIEATTTFTGNLTTVDNGLAVGINQVGSGYTYQGYIDDLRITKGYARYTANFTPPTAAFPNQ